MKARSPLGSVRSVSPGKWIVQVTVRRPDGTNARVTRRVAGSERDAQRVRAELLAKDDGTTSGKLTFGRYLSEQWLPQQFAKTKSRSRSPRTAENYESKIRVHVLPYRISRVELRKLSGLVLDQHMAALRQARPDLSEQTLHHVFATMRAALKQAVRWGLIPRDPTEAVDDRPHPRRHRARTLTPTEGRAIVEACAGERFGAAFALVLGAGLRPGEVCALRWSDVDLEAAAVEPRAGVVPAVGIGLVERQTKTEGSEAWIPLPLFAVTLLRAHKRRQLEERMAASSWEDETLIFTNRAGGLLRPTLLSRHFQAMRAGLGLPPMRLYDLRHGMARNLRASKVDLETIKQRMRHTRISTTSDSYLDIDEPLSREAAAILDGLFGAPSIKIASPGPGGAPGEGKKPV